MPNAVNRVVKRSVVAEMDTLAMHLCGRKLEHIIVLNNIYFYIYIYIYITYLHITFLALQIHVYLDATEIHVMMIHVDQTQTASLGTTPPYVLAHQV